MNSLDQYLSHKTDMHTKVGFHIRTVYKIRKPRVLTVAKQKLSFLIAALSLVAFVTGNMVGQHGWYAFWKTVMGAEDDAMIAFVGTVPPIARVPDYTQWAKYGGNKELHTYAQVPQDVLRDLPAYDVSAITSATPNLAKQTYTTMWAGGYDTTQGSHAGVDIDAPRGTPVVSIGNGIVEKVSMDAVGFGHYVMIRHPNVPDGHGGTTKLRSTYAHLDNVLVTEGTVVHKGQVIGTVGNTGLVFGATGYHLYFEVDADAAPYHPYWPFTSKEIADAGLSFVRAVDSTLYQSRVLQYTINPMAFVEQYRSYTPSVATSGRDGVVAQVAISSSVKGAERLRFVAADRAAQRRAKAGVTVAVASSSSSSSVPSQTVVQVVKTASVEETVVPVPVGGTNVDVDHLVIEHSGKLTHTWQKVNIRAVDRQGETVRSPSFSGRLYIIPEFSEAMIRPSELGPLDFVNGVATVNVLSRSNKTLFIGTRGAFTTTSGPMIETR